MPWAVVSNPSEGGGMSGARERERETERDRERGKEREGGVTTNQYSSNYVYE